MDALLSRRDSEETDPPGTSAGKQRTSQKGTLHNYILRTWNQVVVANRPHIKHTLSVRQQKQIKNDGADASPPPLYLIQQQFNSLEPLIAS